MKQGDKGLNLQLTIFTTSTTEVACHWTHLSTLAFVSQWFSLKTTIWAEITVLGQIMATGHTLFVIHPEKQKVTCKL